MTAIEDTKAALNTLRHHINEWPTNQQLRERKNPNMTPAATPGIAYDPDALPFGLDRTLDTATRIRTRQGACVFLNHTRRQWEHYLDQRDTNITDPIANINWLATNLARESELPPAYRQATHRAIQELARECANVTGHGADPTVYVCPTCGTGTLERPYTGDGIADMYVCSNCNETWTYSHHVELARAHARLRPTTLTVTLAEAATILGVDLGTLHARATRRAVVPTGKKGRRKTYRLDDLK